MTEHKERKYDYLWAFLIPIIIMLVVFAQRGVYPFGNETLLTVDLGQQYIDFYREIKRTLTEAPETLFYSWSKSIGGEMTGIWAYYLASPLNLIFLFFPDYQLDTAVTALTLLKYGLSGLFMALYLKKMFQAQGPSLLAFSTAYALSGYQIVYQMNPMWIDGVFLLPLIALALEDLLRQQKIGLFILFLFFGIFSNYYIGYMIVIFISLYFLYRLFAAYEEGRHKDFDWSFPQYAFRSTIKFSLGGFLAFAMGAFLHIPTVLSLLASKGTYANDRWDFSLAYPPQDVLSRLVVGGFDFDQLPDGLPNLFVGSFVILLFISYFFNSKFSVKRRLLTGGFTLFLLLSMNIKALDKIWHVFQYPVWFPYRFSFVLIFLMIVIGYRSFQEFKGLTTLQTIISLLISTGLLYGIYEQNFEYIETYQLFISFLFLALYILLLSKSTYRIPKVITLITGLTLLELGVNAGISQSRISYVDHDRFQYAQALLDEGVQPITQQDKDFYRIEKTFHRSKNDAHQANYKGATLFSSTLERAIAELYQALGHPGGSGYAVYSNGTLLTDALFGIKYYINEWQGTPFPSDERIANIFGWKSYDELVAEDQIKANPIDRPEDFDVYIVQSKPDLNHYPLLDQTPGGLDIRYNPYHLGLGYTVKDSILDIDLDQHPADLQNDLFRALIGDSADDSDLLTHSPVSIHLENLRPSKNVDGDPVMYVMDEDKDARMTLTFDKEANDSYYLYINGHVNTDYLNYRLNDQGFYSYQTYEEGIFLNLGGGPAQQEQIFEIDVTGSELNVSKFELYRLDTERFEEEIRSAQERSMEISDHSPTNIKGQVHIHENNDVLLFTIPYNEGWTIIANGQKIQPIRVMDSLMAVKLSPGTYQIELTYKTPGLGVGLTLTIIAVPLFLGIYYYENKKK